MKLNKLSTDELLKASENITIAREIIKSPGLLDTLGRYDRFNGKDEETLLDRLTEDAKSEYFKYSSGYYIFTFLSLHEEIYKEIKSDNGIMDRLSDFQKEALHAKFSGQDEYIFYKYR